MKLATIVCVVALLGAAACETQANEEPVCRPGSPTTLMAESVPSASRVPCVRRVPEGWSFQSFTADESAASFSLEQQDGGGSLTVSLQTTCPSSAAAPSEDVTRARTTRDDGRTTVWTTTFPGGCSVATLTLSETVTSAARRAARSALGTIARAELAPTSIAVTHVGP